MDPPSPVPGTGADRIALGLLLATLAVAGAWLWLTGELVAKRVPDTPSYMEASRAGSLEAALSHHRTVGFPTLIRVLYRMGASRDVIPVLGLAVYFLGVLLFFQAVRRYSDTTWLALAAALPLPFAAIVQWAGPLLPDFLASAFSLLAVACLLLIVTERRNGWAWLGLGVTLFLAYQFRPAAQFLVALLPLLAGPFLWLRAGARFRDQLRLAAAVAAITLIPFLLFCTLRLATVGHFGLVSFGGSNLAAAVVNFLDTELVQELPEESRDLGRKILRQRRQRGWRTMTLDSPPIPFFQQSNDNLFRFGRSIAKQESRRAARQPGAVPVDPEININVDVDRRLTRLAVSIIRLRPELYLHWVRQAALYGLRQLNDYVWIVGPALLLVVSVPIAWLRRPPKTRAVDARRRPFPGSRDAALTMLMLLAVAYFATYLLLASATYFPFDRYFVSTTLFLPSALFATLVETWRRILQPS